MNSVLTFLEKNRQRLELEKWGGKGRLAAVMMTPRFRASSHVIVFVVAESRPEPILVVKLPRIPGDNARLDREAENLRAAQNARPGGFDSIPAVVAYEDYCGHRLLIETALAGTPMNPATVRRNPQASLEAALAWLIEMNQATASPVTEANDWFERLLVAPLQSLRRLLPRAGEEEQLIERTLSFIAPFRRHALRTVLEHADFSPPNIFFSGKEGIGVVDWELAEPRGLPATDLFFFLTYVASAQRNARKNADYLAAFREAFFGKAAWARPYVSRYAAALQLQPELLPLLFIACWSRYVAGLVTRLQDGEGLDRKIDEETVKWLHSNRYYVLWRYTIEHVKDLQVSSFMDDSRKVSQTQQKNI